MRIGLVCPYDMGAHGGVQDQVRRLSRWLRDAGHDVVLVGPGSSDDPSFVSVGPVTVVPANGAATPVALAPSTVDRVVDALSDVDVAHVHEPLMPQVSLAALRKATVPMVGTFHADVSRVGEWVYRLGKLITAKWFRRLNVVTAVSPIAARVLGDSARVRIIPNGIDHDEYAPTSKLPGTVAFLGRNDERKGLPILLEAWPKIRAASLNATLTVIGSDDQTDLPGVRFVGRVSEEAKRQHLAETAVFCAPNLSGESFGIVVVEAMAAACAVVASGLPAFVQVAGDTAKYVAPRDADGLAREVATLLNDAAVARVLGDRARVESARFGRDVVLAAYLDCYREALAIG